MNRTSCAARLSCCALLWLILGASGIAVAQTPPRNATFRTIPSPPPADQPFDAVFGAVMDPGALGFWGTHPQYRVQSDRVDLLFDTGCGFICPGPVAPVYIEYPLVMPALAAGRYTVRFAMGDFDNPSEILGEFPMVVGGAAAPAQLPAGNAVPWLLGVLLLTAALARIRLSGTNFAKTK